MSELDYSRLGGVPSYGDAVTGAGDMLLQAIKIRDARRQHAASVQQQQMALQRQSAKDAQDLQLKRDALAQGDQKLQLEGRRYDEGRNATATTAVEKAYREGGLPAAQTAAGGYNVPLTVEHSGEAPGEPPQAPPEPKPVERPEDLPIPGSGLWPPELRAMMAASQAKAAAAKPRQGPAGTEDAYLPEQEGRPNMPTEPLPANADAVDQELYKSHAQELAEWEARHKQRQAAQEQLRAFEVSQAGQLSPQAQAAAQGFQEQGQRELEHAGQQEAIDQFPAQMREYNSRAEAYARSAHPVLALGDRKVSLPTQGELDQPNEKAAQDFLAAQLPLAQDPAQIAAIKRTAASIRTGAMKPTEAGKAVETTVAAGTKAAAHATEQGQYHLTADEQVKQRELDRQSQGRAAAANRALTGDNVDTKKLTQYETTSQHALGNVLSKANVKELQEASKGLSMLKDDPNGVQGQLALDKMAKEAMGGRGTNMVIQRAWNAIPMADRLENQVTLQATGHHSKKVLNIFRKTLQGEVSAARETAVPLLQSVEEDIGLKSPYAQDPGIRPHVKSKMRAAYRSMGMEPPPEYSDEPPKKKAGQTAQELLDENGY